MNFFVLHLIVKKLNLRMYVIPKHQKSEKNCIRIASMIQKHQFWIIPSNNLCIFNQKQKKLNFCKFCSKKKQQRTLHLNDVYKSKQCLHIANFFVKTIEDRLRKPGKIWHFKKNFK